MPINSGGTQTAAFDSLTVRLDMTSPPADGAHYLKCQYANKDGQTYGFRLSYDGIWPHWKDDARSVDMPYPDGGAMELTISGLSTGPHNIITYHNNPYPASKRWTVDDRTYASDVSSCVVSVDGRTCRHRDAHHGQQERCHLRVRLLHRPGRGRQAGGDQLQARW